MKKKLKKVFLIFFILIGFTYNFCFADAIAPNFDNWPFEVPIVNDGYVVPNELPTESTMNVVSMIIIGIIIAVIVTVAIIILIKSKKDKEENNKK